MSLISHKNKAPQKGNNKKYQPKPTNPPKKKGRIATNDYATVYYYMNKNILRIPAFFITLRMLQPFIRLWFRSVAHIQSSSSLKQLVHVPGLPVC